VDGVATRSCVTPVASIGKKEITTLEGIGSEVSPHALQKAFIKEQAAQCGYCTNGMIMTAKALLDANPKPSEEGVRIALANNLCRCGTHLRVISADTAHTPNETTTSRSHSIIESGTAVRLACADARAILLSKAATRLNVSIDKLSANDGAISAEASSITVKYWELIEPESLTYLVSGRAPTKDPKNYKIVGQSIARLDLPNKIMGRASFVHDYRPTNVLAKLTNRRLLLRVDEERCGVQSQRLLHGRPFCPHEAVVAFVSAGTKSLQRPGWSGCSL
jgi:hypothetical protein